MEEYSIKSNMHIDSSAFLKENSRTGTFLNSEFGIVISRTDTFLNSIPVQRTQTQSPSLLAGVLCSLTVPASNPDEIQMEFQDTRTENPRTDTF